MKLEVFPSILKGDARVSGSKSMAQRAAACALLASGETELHSFPDNDDCQAALTIVQQLGGIVTRHGSSVVIRGGFPANFQSGIRNPKSILTCGESGLSARMFTSIAALHGDTIQITGSGSLLKRPFDELEHFLPPLGVTVSTQNGGLPVKVKGPLTGGSTTLDGRISSQFLTGLLLAAGLSKQDTVIYTEHLNSKPYVDMTIEIARHFGVIIKHKNYTVFTVKGSQHYRAAEFDVAGDWSSAAGLLVAAALCSEEGVTVSPLNQQITQADSRIIEVLRTCGASVSEKKNSITVKKREILAFDFDASDCPDLFPALAALAVFSNGVCTLKGVNRLIHKESNRAKSLQEEFAKANIRILIHDDEMKIFPCSPSPAVLSSRNDHRIAMAAAILGLAGSRVTINGAECVKKSFPLFFETIENLGARIKRKTKTSKTHESYSQ